MDHSSHEQLKRKARNVLWGKWLWRHLVPSITLIPSHEEGTDGSNVEIKKVGRDPVLYWKQMFTNQNLKGSSFPEAGETQCRGTGGLRLLEGRKERKLLV